VSAQRRGDRVTSVGFQLTPGSAPARQSFDVWSLASSHGLKPVRSGSRVRFYCPLCDQAGSKRSKGRTASCDIREDNHPWKCWRGSCDVSGTARTLAAILGELIEDTRPVPRRIPKPLPKPTPQSRCLDVGGAWDQLVDAGTQEQIGRVFRWGRHERGWPEDIADAVSHLDDLALPSPTEVGGRGGRRLFREGDRMGLHLLVAIQSHKGHVVSVSRRWAGFGQRRPGAPKAATLSSKVTGPSERWGGTWAYGSIPNAVDAAERGETVVFVEGAPDYLAGTALMTVGGQVGSVVGWYNTTTAKTLTRQFVHALSERGIIAPRVVLVPDIDRGGVGLSVANECATILRGRAGVAMVELPADEEGKADLSAHLSAHGVEDTLARLRTAAPLFPAPVSLQRSVAEMEAILGRAIIEATNRTSHDRRTIVLVQVPAGVGKSTRMLVDAVRVAHGEIPIRYNGRRPKGWPAAGWPPPERRVVFACPDHDECEAKMGQLPAATPARHIYGALHYCDYAEKVDSVFPSVGRRGICGKGYADEQKCPQLATCPGARDPEAYMGDVTFVPHALVGSATLKADLFVVDESPSVDVTTVATAAEVATLFAHTGLPRVKRWRREVNPEAADAAQLLCDLVQPLANAHAADVSRGTRDPYSHHVFGDELVALFATSPHLEPLLEAGYTKGTAPPPVPFPAEARAGVHGGAFMPSRPAFEVMRDLLGYLLRLVGKVPDPDADDPLRIVEADGTPVLRPRQPIVAIRLDTDGTWCLEARKIKRLPKAPVLVLDATGDDVLAHWRAAYPDRRVVMRTLDVQGTAPATAIHLSSPGFTRRSMLSPVGAPRPVAVPRIRQALETLAARTRGHHPRFTGGAPTRLGIITHKPIADVLNGEGPHATSAAGTELRNAVLDLIRRGFDVMVGYFGRHDRGTNAFQSVDGLAMLGDPVGNLSDVAMRAKLLGLDPETMSRQLTAATCKQAIARARHIRRGTEGAAEGRAVLMFAGRAAPEVPGVVWTEERLKEGAPQQATTVRLRDLLHHVAGVEGALGVKVVERFDASGTPLADLDVGSISRSTLARTIKSVAKARRWGSFRVSTGDASTVVYAQDSEQARRWATENLAPGDTG